VKVTGLATFVAPAAGEIADGAVLLLQVGWVVIVIDAPALLLFPFGSEFADATTALSPALPLESAVAVMINGAAAPIGSDDIVQTIVRPAVAHDHPLPDAIGALTPKRLCASRTFCAEVGPLFATLDVKVIVPPALTGFGPAVIVSIRSAESRMATVVLPGAAHEPVVTVTLMTTLLPLPAVQVIDGVPLPLVIVPPEIDQA